jgi:hypothetical protein
MPVAALALWCDMGVCVPLCSYDRGVHTIVGSRIQRRYRPEGVRHLRIAVTFGDRNRYWSVILRRNRPRHSGQQRLPPVESFRREL